MFRFAQVGFSQNFAEGISELRRKIFYQKLCEYSVRLRATLWLNLNPPCVITTSTIFLTQICAGIRFSIVPKTMIQQLHFLTIGVTDFDKMKSFYINTFGWKPMTENEGICFFNANGMVFSIYPKHELAEDIGIPDEPIGFKGVTMAILFPSEEAVDKAFAEVTSKGAQAIKQPVKAFWGGYSSYVADPENNYWELAYNPFIVLDEFGRVIG